MESNKNIFRSKCFSRRWKNGKTIIIFPLIFESVSINVDRNSGNLLKVTFSFIYPSTRVLQKYCVLKTTILLYYHTSTSRLLVGLIYFFFTFSNKIRFSSCDKFASTTLSLCFLLLKNIVIDFIIAGFNFPKRLITMAGGVKNREKIRKKWLK